MTNARRICLALIALTCAAVLWQEVEARSRAPWVLLGGRVVSDRLDHETIRVTLREGKFAKLRLSVRGHAVEFRSMKVHLANGDVVDVRLRRVIPAGERSRVIDLPGARRAIEKISFTYDAQALGGGRATVQLYGRR